MNDFTPVLGDFGMTQTIKHAKSIDFTGGTPLYQGEQVAEKDKELALDDCKADMFALGVIFYQMIYGKATYYINSFSVVKMAKKHPDNYFSKNFDSEI